MKFPSRALPLLAALAACKETRPAGLVPSDVPIIIADSGSTKVDIPVGDQGTPTDRPVTDAATGVDSGVRRDTGPLIEDPFRPIAPLSGSYVRTLRPTFRWNELAGATSYRIEYSTTRAFAAVESSATSAGTTLTPAADLPRGLRWWRVVGLSGASTLRTSVAWPVTIGRERHDLNGDGRADIVVGAPGRDSGDATPTGEVYVYFGAGTVPGTPNLTLTATTQGERFGTAVSTSGDVNGDGYADLLVGAGYFHTGDPAETGETGRAALYLGGASISMSPTLRISAPALSGGFGRTLSIVGDVNGDGFADWVVGAPSFDRLSGRAWLYLGGATPDGTPDLELSYAMPGDAFGAAVASASDLNGDGFSDIVIGAPQTVSSATGEVRVFFGGATPNGGVDANLVGGANDYFGYAVAGVGDFNGDGYGDLAVGAPSVAGRGQAVVFAGAAGALNQRLLEVRGAMIGTVGEKLGNSLDAAGDVNGDGFADLVLGAIRNATNGADTGRAYLFTGGAAPGLTPAVVFNSTDASAGNVSLFGDRAVGAGDVDGDGFDDVLIRAARAPANIGREGGPGAVYLYRGGATPGGTPAWTSVGVGTSQVNEYGYGLALRGTFQPRYF